MGKMLRAIARGSKSVFLPRRRYERILFGPLPPPSAEHLRERLALITRFKGVRALYGYPEPTDLWLFLLKEARTYVREADGDSLEMELVEDVKIFREVEAEDRRPKPLAVQP